MNKTLLTLLSSSLILASPTTGAIEILNSKETRETPINLNVASDTSNSLNTLTESFPEMTETLDSSEQETTVSSSSSEAMSEESTLSSSSDVEEAPPSEEENIETTEESDSPEESTQVSEEPKSSQEKEGRAYTVTNGVAQISTWDDFVDACSDVETSKIVVTTDLTATKDAIINKTMAIEFQNKTIDFKGFAIHTLAQGFVTVSNINFTSTNAAFMGVGYDGKSQGGSYSFTGTINASTTNTGMFIKYPGGKVTFDGATVNYHNSSTKKVFGIDTKDLMITNKSVVNSDASCFYTTASTEDVNGSVTINQGSKVSTTKSATTPNTSIWVITLGCTFTVTGEGSSLDVANPSTTGYAKTFVMESASYSNHVNVLDGAKVSLSSVGSTVFSGNGPSSSLTVDSATFMIHQNGENTTNGGSNYAFFTGKNGGWDISVTNHSYFSVIKDAGTSAAMQMTSKVGYDNTFKVNGASDFIVHQNEKSPTTNWDSARGQAIVFNTYDSAIGEGGVNTFSAEGENTNIELISAGGGVIQVNNQMGPGGTLNILCGQGTYFVGRGKASIHNYQSMVEGVFEATTLNFEINQPKYYDFRNDNGEQATPKGLLFAGGTSSSTFKTSNSNIAFWKSGKDLDGTSDHYWANATFTMSGTNLNTVNSGATPSDINTVFSGENTISKYARISANNQLGQVDAIRTPTDADKYVYVHASFPQGKNDPPRDALDNEVNVEVDVESSNGTNSLSGKTIGKQTIYGEENALGWTKIPYNNFLEKNKKITITKATIVNNSVLPAENIIAKTTTVRDVTPPTPVKSSSYVLAPGAKTLSGETEAGSKITANVNGIAQGVSTIADASGKFSLTFPDTTFLKKGDTIQVFAQDNAGIATGVIKPPVTNSTAGNINPGSVQAYHDAIIDDNTAFQEATWYEVNGTLALLSAPGLSFGTQAVTGKTETYPLYAVEGSLEISDTRDSSTGFSLYVKESTPLTLDGISLSGCVSYKSYTNSNDQVLTNSEILAESYGAGTTTVNVSNDWKSSGKYTTEKGPVLTVGAEKQKTGGTFKGSIEWILKDVPGN